MKKTVFVVESHHNVLPAWAQLRSALQEPPRLITLDHHTDTSKPFRNFLNKMYSSEDPQLEIMRSHFISKIDFKNLAVLSETLKNLSNDEHVITAIQSRIISSAFVIAHKAQNTDLSVYQEHQVMCRTVEQQSPLKRNDYDQVLESIFLDELIGSFNTSLSELKQKALCEVPYILDIDLDYFNTRASIHPKNAETFLKLVSGAALVTVATEPEYVKHCSLDADLSSEELLKSLLELIAQADP
ncbi:MAG: UPF0489 family protein [Bdellovibrionales bacterium]